MAHKLRHGLSERPEYLLDGLIEIDESYYGGRGKPASRGRGLADPNKSLIAIAVETVPASARQGEGIKKSHFVAGSARIAVPAGRHRGRSGRLCPRRSQARRPHHH